MLNLTKQVFIVLLSFSQSLVCVTKVSERTKCASLNDEPCMIRPTITDLGPVEHYLFMIILDKCTES